MTISLTDPFMRTWHTTLIGAVVGPLVGVPFIRYACFSSPDVPMLLYPVVWSMDFLADIFMPGKDYAGLVFYLPVLVLYCATAGALVALTARFFCRRFLI